MIQVVNVQSVQSYQPAHPLLVYQTQYSPFMVESCFEMHRTIHHYEHFLEAETDSHPGLLVAHVVRESSQRLLMIRKSEFQPNTKHLGQHFLIDESIADSIIALADIQPDDIILEIGPGEGSLTYRLAQKAKRVYAIEIDNRLKHPLEEMAKKADNIELIWGNALQVPFPQFDKLVSSLPYQILEPLLNKLIQDSFKFAVLVTGSRFGFTILQHPQDIGFKKLGVLVNSFFYPEIKSVVPSNAFSPKPRMSSTVMVLRPKKIMDLMNDQTLFLFRLLLEQRDKKIKNGLREAIIRVAETRGIRLTKNQARKLIVECGIPDDILENWFESLSNPQLEILGKAFGRIII